MKSLARAQHHFLSNCLTLLFFICSTSSPSIQTPKVDAHTTFLNQTKPAISDLGEPETNTNNLNETQRSFFIYSSVPGSRPSPKISNSKTKCMLIVNLLILNCGDIETNPGPSELATQSSFPCAISMSDVSWNADALQCDGCDLWQHRNCIGISQGEYSRLGKSPLIWICANVVSETLVLRSSQVKIIFLAFRNIVIVALPPSHHPVSHSTPLHLSNNVQQNKQLGKAHSPY